MQDRKTIMIQPDPLMRICKWLALICVLVSWVLAFYYYPGLPDIIPIHFDGAGNANGFGSRYTIFLVPCIAAAVILGINWLARYPHLYNYAQTVNEENRERLYKSGVKTLYVVNAVTGLILLLAMISILNAAYDTQNKISGWILPIIIGLSASLTIYAIVGAIKSAQVKK